ncbi:MAG TPA: class I SAM-dependent methyltransferase [Firmicutes bacterium]|nr:class I SAM-dependent methyltransferase [Bacillota bacterium]
MSEHYYANKPTAAHQRQVVRLDINDVHLVLVTDTGVFSRRGVDAGTRLLLESVPAPAEGVMLDMGCGYGPIGLYFAAVCPYCQVHMSDINERAVELSRENAVRNGLRNVTVFCGEAFAPLQKQKYHLIVTNPPIRAGKQCLLQMFSAAHRHLLPGGRFAFVARTQQGAKTLAKAVEQIFGNITDLARGGGYRVYMAYKDADATVALD